MKFFSRQKIELKHFVGGKRVHSGKWRFLCCPVELAKERDGEKFVFNFFSQSQLYRPFQLFCLIAPLIRGLSSAATPPPFRPNPFSLGFRLFSAMQKSLGTQVRSPRSTLALRAAKCCKFLALGLFSSTGYVVVVLSLKKGAVYLKCRPSWPSGHW